MVSRRLRTVASTTLAISVLLISASMALSQSTNTSSTNARTVSSGQKMKIKGVVTRRGETSSGVKKLGAGPGRSNSIAASQMCLAGHRSR